jgi:serine/threonine-protein kinase
MTDQLDRVSTALADRYRIERELGAGGMATVYLAEDLKHHRKVALKVLRPELAAILGSERFLKEIEVTANLQHPNILPLYDSGNADSFLYYVMPFVEGESLRDKLNREQQLSVEETVKLAESVAAALEYAHQHDVIHRDIKPENILLQSGQALVADFGIALAVRAAGGTRLTETGLSLGTPHYMSPEQATGDRELDARSDVYSLGVMVYEMLVGEPPHLGNSAQAIIAKILSETPAPIGRTREMVPGNVDAAVHKALAKSPADRFTSAAQFAAALMNPAFTLPTPQATTVGDAPPGWQWNRLSTALTALVAGLLLIIIWALVRPEPPQPVTRFGVALAEDEVLVRSEPAAFGTSIALAPDGSRFVYVGPAGDSGFQLWVKEQDHLSARPIAGTIGGRQPFFAPDGQRIGFIVRDTRELKAVSLTGEPPVTLATSDLFRLGGAWAPDGYVYFVLRPEGGLARVPATGGGVPEPVTTLDTARGERRHAWPDILPNGKGVLVTVEHENGFSEQDEIAVVDLALREHRVLVRGLLGRYAQSGHLVYVRFDGALMAVPFDQEKLELTGAPVSVAGNIQVSRGPDLALSREGTLLYMSGLRLQDPEEMVWVARDGTAQEIDPGWTADFSALALSPDGTQLVVSVRTGEQQLQLWVKDLNRGPLHKLTFEGTVNRDPAWMPDGRSIMFVSNRGEDFNVYVKPADGGQVARLVLDLERPINQAFPSPNGEWMVYTVGEVPDWDIFAIRPGVDSVPIALAAEAGVDEYDPALSPDGRWLAYTSDESGRSEVFVRRFPNGATKWQVSTNGGRQPRWAHSGRELFYRTATGPFEMVAVEVLLGATFVRGTQRSLFSSGPLDPNRWHIAPDDQRFLFVRLRDAGGQLVLVENFFEELTAKVGK